MLYILFHWTLSVLTLKLVKATRECKETFTLASLAATASSARFALGRVGLFGLSVLVSLLARVALAILHLHGVIELKLGLRPRGCKVINCMTMKLIEICKYGCLSTMYYH